MRLVPLLATTLLAVASAQSAEFYVCAATGKGKAATKEEPAKDLGNLIPMLKPGDTVHIAEGVYTGRADCGADMITVPVRIIGGYSADFAKRDPWGAHRTVLSGDNKAKNFDTGPRLAIDCQKFKERGDFTILVDGVIVDDGARNRYSGKESKIERKANPAAGEMPTPERGAIRVVAPANGLATCAVTVQNCAVVNSAPTQGAISAWGYAKSVMTIRNNLVVNVTGNGIDCLSTYHPKDGKDLPAYTVSDNTVLYVWKYDAYGEIGGNGIQFDTDITAKVSGNAVASADIALVNNAKRCKDVLLKDNCLNLGGKCAYLEFSTAIDFKDLADTPQNLARESGGNVDTAIVAGMPTDWAERYAARTVINRNAAEAGVKADDSRANALRSILGLPLQAADLKVDSDIWLHRLPLEAALAVGKAKFHGKFGCAKP